MTEEEILSGCREHDRRAQHELYTRTSDRIYSLLSRLTHSEHDAADLLQNTYIRAFTHIDRFQGASSLSTWIYRIAVNEARQFLRQRKRQGEILRHEAPPPPETVESSEAMAGDRMDLSDALDRLPDEERILIVLRYLQDMDYARMAEVLEKPAGTIASGLNRARRMLRGVLEEPQEKTSSS